MKSTVKRRSDVKPEYPILMESLDDGLIVLFVREHTGICVGGDISCEAGLGDVDFCDAENEELWRVFNGKVILEN